MFASFELEALMPSILERASVMALPAPTLAYDVSTSISEDDYRKVWKQLPRT
ncbi:hypothetical protein P3597_08590 [Vibrio parahaemolyticus]|nr:hypothetical protein [Vibrio parahaemolyticus]MDF5644776.1 hypothetical protein [Vibrio parahaemolyticus]HBH7908028.1 hypothetical protein [Vibrio parahaemolyticus]